MCLLHILRLPKDVQIAVALIVWYDECGDDPVKERNTLFDPFLNHPERNAACQRVTREQIYNGLITIGWSRYKAQRRLAIKPQPLTVIPNEEATSGTPDITGGIDSELEDTRRETGDEGELEDSRMDH